MGKLIRRGIFTLFDCTNKVARYSLFLAGRRDELPGTPIKLDGAAINLGLRLLKVNDAAVALKAATPLFQGEYLTGERGRLCSSFT